MDVLSASYAVRVAESTNCAEPAASARYDAGTAKMDNTPHPSVRHHNRLFSRFSLAAAAALLAGLALRLWWVYRFGQTTNDTRIYGEFARNLLEFHVYGFTNA